MLSLLCLASLSLVQAGSLPGSEEFSGANWIDVCSYHDQSGAKCCAPGMSDHRYLVLPHSSDWSSHLAECHQNGGWLTVFETQEEWACVGHYVSQVFHPSAQRYAISLRSDFGSDGIYKWQYEDGTSAFPEFQFWAPGHPKDEPCVSMELDGGLWIDGDCYQNQGIFAICEKALPTTTTTTTTPNSSSTTSMFCDNVGLDITVRNSQDNNPVSNAFVSVTIDDEIVAENVPVGPDGSVFIPVYRNGVYIVDVEAEGFIPGTFEMEVLCTSADCDCPNVKLFTMSPTLDFGQTRIIMNWEKNIPRDVDIHVVSVKDSDQSTCRTYYADKQSCEAISLDLDNTSGGLNGAETMTLLDAAVNKDYVYVVGIEDFRFESNGDPFLSSGSRITITNGVQTVYSEMVASSISSSEEFYFFGCVKVTAEGEYRFVPAPEGTFFNGNVNNGESIWVDMMNNYCGFSSF